MQKEADESNKRSSVLERENQRCDLQLGDMAQQVGSQSFVSLKDCPSKIHDCIGSPGSQSLQVVIFCHPPSLLPGACAAD